MSVLLDRRATVGVPALLPTVGADTRVPLVDGGTATYADLDVAASAPALSGVAARVAGALEDHERALRSRLVGGLAQVEGVRLLRIWSDSVDPTGVVSFTVEGADPGLVAAYLSAEHGIGTSSADVDRLVAAITRFVAHGPGTDHAVVDGRHQPVADPRPVAGLAGADLSAVARGAGCGPSPVR